MVDESNEKSQNKEGISLPGILAMTGMEEGAFNRAIEELKECGAISQSESKEVHLNSAFQSAYFDHLRSQWKGNPDVLRSTRFVKELRALANSTDEFEEVIIYLWLVERAKKWREGKQFLVKISKEDERKFEKNPDEAQRLFAIAMAILSGDLADGPVA